MTPAADSQPGQVDTLLPLVYDELRAIARAYFRRQPASFTLCPTEIVHEACMHLMRHGPSEWDSPQHFRAIATRKIWQIIVDHLKQRSAAKRGGAGVPRSAAGRSASSPASATGERAGAAAEVKLGARTHASPAARRVPLESITVDWIDRRADLMDVAEALEALDQEASRLHDVTLLHWFGGMTHDEVARALAISPSTAEKDWRYAVAWLKRRLAERTHVEH